MDDAMTGKGIRAEAREEIRRLSVLRQDSAGAIAALTALVAELVEAEVPASLEMLPASYGKASIAMVLKMPPVHPEEGSGIPAWPDQGLEAVGYEVSVTPSLNCVDIEGPYGILYDGSLEPMDEDDRHDPAYHERFKTEGGAGFLPLSSFVQRVRTLAISREVSIQSLAASPAA